MYFYAGVGLGDPWPWPWFNDEKIIIPGMEHTLASRLMEVTEQQKATESEETTFFYPNWEETKFVNKNGLCGERTAAELYIMKKQPFDCKNSKFTVICAKNQETWWCVPLSIVLTVLFSPTHYSLQKRVWDWLAHSEPTDLVF